jgi:GTP-binding protein
MSTRLRVLKTLEVIQRVDAQRKQRISTGQLNSFLEDLFETHPPPAVKGRQIHIYYATQMRVEPPTFVFFTNSPQLIHTNYRRFLERKLRQSFGFEGTPVHFIFRQRKGKKRRSGDPSR